MTGDMVVNLYVQDVWRKANKFNTRKVFPSDKERLLNYIKETFPNKKGGLWKRRMLNIMGHVSYL